MKKALMMMLISSVVFMSACGGAPQNQDTSSSSSSSEITEAENTESSEQQANSGSIAGTLKAEFKELASSGRSPLEIAEALLASEVIEFGGVTSDVEPGFLPGFSSDIMGFEAGASFAPMIGSIPFVGYVLQTGSEADAAALLDELKSAADLRWNVCTEADEMEYDTIGNLVFFVMSPAEF